jgi:hypothetical protein
MTMIDDRPITDEELTALALAADRNAAIDADAVPWSVAGDLDGPLPDWYMPAPSTVRRGWKTKAVAAVLILAFLVINACGLCITYGHLVVA